jgi:hypothetical protein
VIAWLQALLERQTWTSARMQYRGQSPHQYVVLVGKWNASAEDFYRAVALIREHGVDSLYHGRPTPAPGHPPYRKLALGRYVYWSMGWPVPETELINRTSVEEEARQQREWETGRNEPKPTLQPRLFD